VRHRAHRASPTRRPSVRIAAPTARFPMLGDKRRAPAGTLSGGQQQILEMAMALLLHPRLLLVDEQQARVEQQRHSHLEDLLLTAAQGAGGSAALVAEHREACDGGLDADGRTAGRGRTVSSMAD